MIRHSHRILTVLLLLASVGCNSDSLPNAPSADQPSALSKSNATSLPTVHSGNAVVESAEARVSAANEIETATAAVAEVTALTAADNAKPETKQTKAPATPTPEQLSKWTIPDFKPLQLLTCYDGFDDSLIDAMAVSPNGRQFVLGGIRLTLWNTAESKPIVDLIADLKGDEIERPIRSAAFSPDGQWLAAGDQKGMLRVWRLSDQQQVIATKTDKARLTQLAFSPNSQTLATTSYSGEVTLWKIPDGKKIKALKMSEREIEGMIFLSDQLLATAGSEASVWNIENEKREASLTTGYTIGQALGLSKDRRTLAFSDAESNVHFWDVEQRVSVNDDKSLGGAGGTIAFSDDGKWMAARASDSTIRLWDVASRQTVQVIDADGGRTVDLAWLPQSSLLLIASENGRVRIWGTPESAESYALKSLDLPEVKPVAAEDRKPLTSAQLQRVIDIRSFPRLPGASVQWSQFSMLSYGAPCTQAEAELFYRYHLDQAGWVESTATDQVTPGLAFRKDGCELNVSFSPSAGLPGSKPGDLHVSLYFAGNYDVRWLSKHSAIESQSTYASFYSASYRTKANLTDIEVSLLKQFHEAGWTGYSRLASSNNDDPHSRTFSMLQGGEELIVSIGYPADSTEELYVQTSVSVKNKALPIPPDAGWIEFDSSTNLQLVANTKMNLNDTVTFYNEQMASWGWMAREPGRQVKDGKAWLPYIHGQQDVLIRLVTLPDKKTRVIVGEAESSSWQLTKPPAIDPENTKNGIEAATFLIPENAASVKFEIDQKQIQFEVPSVNLADLADKYAKQLESLDWKRDKSGVVSDDYVLATYLKGKAEIQLRARWAENKNASAIISGDGLLWSMPLPTPPVRVSFGTWLRRDRRIASLELLNEFADAMQKLPTSSGPNK